MTRKELAVFSGGAFGYRADKKASQRGAWGAALNSLPLDMCPPPSIILHEIWILLNFSDLLCDAEFHS